MIDTLLNLMFRCSHRRLTRPVTPVSKAGVPHGETYVVCLDCGKQFAYDLNLMRIGKAIDHSHDACVLPAAPPKPRHRKLKYAFWASVPLAVVVGAALNGPKGVKERIPPPGKKPDTDSGEPK
jgi:DNA-directed RNA polymerase subunit RPC12/RpoP